MPQKFSNLKQKEQGFFGGSVVKNMSANAGKWEVKVRSLSHVRLFATPWTAAHQAPPPLGFSRQEPWSGLPLPSPQYSTINHQIFVNKTMVNEKQCHYIFIRMARIQTLKTPNGGKCKKQQELSLENLINNPMRSVKSSIRKNKGREQ